MSRIPELSRDELDADGKQLYDEILAARGSIAGPFRVWLHKSGDRHPGTHQLRKQLGPLADHNRVREHQGAPRQISLSKLFANSIATFAFISARSAHIRRYFWN